MEQLDLSRALHRLTARLDRAGDQILQAEAGLSYSRFLALYMVGFEGADTQRVLAEQLGITEPSVSRMTRVLAQARLLEAASDPAGGNRHRLRLSPSGQELVERLGGELERRFASLVQTSGVPYDVLLEHTKRLLDTLDAAGSWTSSAPETAATRRADR